MRRSLPAWPALAARPFTSRFTSTVANAYAKSVTSPFISPFIGAFISPIIGAFTSVHAFPDSGAMPEMGWINWASFSRRKLAGGCARHGVISVRMKLRGRA